MAFQKALLTGATGYIGSKLATQLVQDGWQVACIVLPDDPCAVLQRLQGKLKIFRHDGTTDNLIEIMKSFCPDVVFHLASCFLAEHQSGDIERLITSNVLFGTQLLEGMSKAGITRLVNTGTSWQHYQNENYNPVCLYAATKQAFEDIIRFYTEAQTVRCVTLKLLDTYGPDDPRPKLFSFLRRAASAQDTIDMSPGEQTLDLVHIDDVVSAFICAAELTASSSRSMMEYAVRTGRPLPLNEIVRIYEDLLGAELPIRFGGREYRKREVMVAWDGAETVPGWRAEVTLEEGVKSLLDQQKTDSES